MKKNLFLSFFFFLICNIALAGSDENTLERPRYKIEVDSQVIKATPYEITFENGKEIHHDENVEWYTDMTVYKFISKDLDENGKV